MLVAQVDGARLVASLERIQSRDSRVAGTEGAFAVADAIDAELSALGLEVERTPFRVSNVYDGGRALMTENVAVHLGPDDAARIVLIAHLDARGAKDPEAAKKNGWRWDRSPAPGADDNGSGCAVLLELARLLSSERLSKRIDLVFTGAEEMAVMHADGFMANLGADRAADDRASAEIEGVIAIDMVLRARPWGHSLRVYSDGRLASAELAQAILHASWIAAPAVEVEVKTDPGFTWSDHGSFWAYGVPAVLVIEDDFHHARYHTPEDRYAAEDPFYDPAQLEAATRLLLEAVLMLARDRG